MMPWDDVQFYMVTGVACVGAWTLIRKLFPKSTANGSPCGACASGAAACASKRRPSVAGKPTLVTAGDRTPSLR